MRESDTIISVENLSKVVTTGDKSLTILSSVSLQIKPAESVAIIGASGSGKSTLLGLLAGLDTPSAGRILIHGQDITQLDEDQRAQLRAEAISFVFQSFHLLPGLTALENVLLPLELAASPDASAQAEHWLQQVGLGERLQHYPAQLSGGEQQRVAVARAFATRPQILFADEPTGNLDADTGRQIADLIFELNASLGTTLVLVTHDPELAARCQRSLHLQSGQLISDA